DNCDYTFKTLQENMLKALAAVKLSTIWKWEHHMIQWMEAYRSGLGAKAAQFQVRSSIQSSTNHTGLFQRP
ncbi:hypothetical protein L208DRAFT_1235117, partial [Tricholoma matsutake]